MSELLAMDSVEGVFAHEGALNVPEKFSVFSPEFFLILFLEGVEIRPLRVSILIIHAILFRKSELMRVLFLFYSKMS